jgi:hypothetical protein
MMEDERSAGSWLVLVAVLVVGCPKPEPVSYPVNHGGRAIQLEDASKLLQRVTEANDGYGTLKSIHQVAIEIALGGDRQEQRTFKGVIAVRRPGAFRLRVLGPAGIDLFDLLYLSGKVKILHVADMLKRSSKLPQILSSVAEDIRTIYRLDPKPEVTRRKMEESVSLASGSAPLYVLRGYRGDKLVREMDIFAASLAIARSEVVSQEGAVRTVTYGDYEQVGEVLVPRSIHVGTRGESFYWLSIKVKSVTLNEELNEELFTAGQSDEAEDT